MAPIIKKAADGRAVKRWGWIAAGYGQRYPANDSLAYPRMAFKSCSGVVIECYGTGHHHCKFVIKIF